MPGRYQTCGQPAAHPSSRAPTADRISSTLIRASPLRSPAERRLGDVANNWNKSGSVSIVRYAPHNAQSEQTRRRSARCN